MLFLRLGKFCGRGSGYLELEWNILVNSEGKVLYCLPETAEAVESVSEEFFLERNKGNKEKFSEKSVDKVKKKC